MLLRPMIHPSKRLKRNLDAHGFFCNGILSADDRLCRKARAIYEYYGKTNHVFQVAFDK